MDDLALARIVVGRRLAEMSMLEPLGAMNSSTWLVRSRDDRYVVKVADASNAPGLEVARWLAAHGVRTGEPVEMMIREGRVGALLRFVDGRELDPEDASLVGSTLGRVHRALAGAPLPAALPHWPWHWLDPSRIGEPRLRAAAAAAIERAEALTAAVTHGILHGDPAPEAFIAHEDDVGLIDWGSALHGPLLYDVASARMYAGDAVVEAYAATGPLSASELSLLPEFLAYRWAVQAWYFGDRLARGDLTGLGSQADNEKGLADARRALLG